MSGDMLNLGPYGKKPLKDQVTPHKLALLVLIREYCTNFRHLEDQIAPEMGDLLTLTEKEERDFMITVLHLLQSADMELKELMRKLQDISKTELLELFTDRLKDLYEQKVQALMDLFQNLTDTLFPDPSPHIHKSSVLGLFVRRMVLSFDKLSFSQATKLFSRYSAYYKTWHQSRQRAPPADRLEDTSLSMMDLIGDSGNDMGELSAADLDIPSGPSRGGFSQRQAEYFIAQQAHLLQHNELEALAARPLQQKITELLHSNPDLAEAHFLSYLNYLRVNEYCKAVDSLSHYFDRHCVVANGSSTTSKTKGEEDTLGKGFKYAALNMAALQYRFGHRAEALAATKEAIRLAQETNDHVCLQHALGWLHRLGEEGTSNTAYLLDRSVSKSGELNLPYLTSLGVQAFARHNALATAQPSSVFEFLLKSDIINCQHSLTDLMCISYAQKAALWHVYGNREMCSLSSQLMLNLNTAEGSIYHNGETGCLALCNLIRLHANQGHHRVAMELLNNTKKRFPVNSQHAKLWMSCEQEMLFDRATHQANWEAAEKAVTSLAAVDPLEAQYCHARLKVMKGDTSQAFDMVHSLIYKSSHGDKKYTLPPHLYARLLLLQGELYCDTGNPTAATQPLLACFSLCQDHHFYLLHAQARLQLAAVQAVSMLEDIMVTLLSHGSVYDHARVQYLWAQCTVAAASTNSEANKNRAIHTAVQVLNDVVSTLKKIESNYKLKQAIYLQARLYNELGYKAERNKCSLEFRQLDQLYPTTNQLLIALP